MSDHHVHMMIANPPDQAVSHVAGCIRGKSAIHLTRVHGGRKRDLVGRHFRVRGYFVNTVGRDEAAIRDRSRNQENKDSRHEGMGQWR